MQPGKTGSLFQEDAQKEPGSVKVHSIRQGDVLGEHEVIFRGFDEVISLKHVVHDRALFAKGALKAAKYLMSQAPGFYSMRHVFGLPLV